MIKVAGKIDPNPSTGTVTATFDGLPQLPYTDLEVNFRTGQRSFLISPPACGAANTSIQMSPWSSGTPRARRTSARRSTSGSTTGPAPRAPSPSPPTR